MYALGQHYGVSVSTILNFNKNVKASSLQIGQKLVIPAIRAVGEYPGKSQTSSSAKTTSDEDANLYTSEYTVKKGDTLWSIALNYGVQVEQLAEVNNINVNSVLSIGKKLKVPPKQ